MGRGKEFRTLLTAGSDCPISREEELSLVGGRNLSR